MPNKNHEDIRNEYLVVFGAVAFALFLIVIAITSKHINSKNETTRETNNYFASKVENFHIHQKNTRTHLIKETTLTKKSDSPKNNKELQRNEFIDFLYLLQQSDRSRDNWEYRNY